MRFLLLFSLALPALFAACPKSDPLYPGVPLPGESRAISEARRLADFDQLTSLFVKNYGPYEWKLKSLPALGSLLSQGKPFDLLDRGLDAYWTSRLKAVQSDLDFAEELIDWVAQLRDAHSELRFPSSYAAGLGFEADLVGGLGGKLLVTLVEDCASGRWEFLADPDNATFVASYPTQWISGKLAVGDQILRIGSVDARDVVANLLRYIPGGGELGRRRLAARMLALRKQSISPKFALPDYGLPGASPDAAQKFGRTVPCASDPLDTGLCVAVDVLRPNGSAATVVARWITSGTPLRYGLVSPKLPAAAKAAADPATPASRSMALVSESHRASPAVQPAFWAELARLFPGNVLGANQCRRIFCEVLSFDGRNVPFVRIPTFEPLDGVEESDRVNELADFLSANNVNVAGYVVDVGSNPGGSIPLADAMARQFLVVQFQPPGFQIRATEAWVRDYDVRIAALESEKTGLLQYVRNALVRASAELRGRTGPLSLNKDAFDTVPANPDSDRNKQAVLVLVDELSASAAEYFAAIFQFNGVGIVAGLPTLGAGGNVGEYPALIHSGAKVRLTESLMSRNPLSKGAGGRAIDLADQDIIEDLGVRPDFGFEFDIADPDRARALAAIRKALCFQILARHPLVCAGL